MVATAVIEWQTPSTDSERCQNKTPCTLRLYCHEDEDSEEQMELDDIMLLLALGHSLRHSKSVLAVLPLEVKPGPFFVIANHWLAFNMLRVKTLALLK